MDKKIFIHIGTHKTGTTAIQDFLKLNRNALSRRGYLYPQRSRRDYHGLLDGETIVPPGKYKNYAKLVKLCRSKGKHVILSNETLCLIRDVSSIKTALGDANVNIICYLRGQDSFIQSYYNQAVKNGECYKEITEWDPQTYLDYYELLNRWAAVFGKKNIIARPYEKQQFKKGDLISDFLNVVGVEASGDFQTLKKNTNPRLPMEAIEYMRLLNSLLQDRKESKDIRRKIVAYFAEKDKKNASSIYYNHSLLSPEQTRALRDQYTTSNQRVAQEYVGREDGRLFFDAPYPSSSPLPSQKILSDEMINQITLSLCRSRKNKKILIRALKQDFSACDAFTRYAHSKISESLTNYL